MRRGSILPACYVVFFPHSIPFYSLKAKKLLLQINFLRKIKTQSEIACSFFLRPRSDHCPSLAVTKQLTQWLTPFVETWMMRLWLREMPTIQICQKREQLKVLKTSQSIIVILWSETISDNLKSKPTWVTPQARPMIRRLWMSVISAIEDWQHGARRQSSCWAQGLISRNLLPITAKD